MIVRFRLDAALYEPAPACKTGKKGRPRLKGKRFPTLAAVEADPNGLEIGHSQMVWAGPQEVEIIGYRGLVSQWSARLAHPLGVDPRSQGQVQIPGPAVYRSAHPGGANLEMVHLALAVGGDFPGSRTHLGVETQRQWSDWAILRTTPALLGLFSMVTLLAIPIAGQRQAPRAESRLVLQTMANFFGCFGARETRNMATSLFSAIAKRI